MRAYATTEGRWRLPVSERDVDPRFFKLLFTYEDKRFHDHHGVDPLSLGRAAAQFISRGQIISGGSTISMQVARLLEPRERRSLGAKMRQIVAHSNLNARSARMVSSRSIWHLHPMAETWRAYARLHSPISARSRANCRWQKLRCWSPCRSLLNCAGPIVSRPLRGPRAIVCSTGQRLQELMPRDEIARAKSQPVPNERRPLPVLAPHAADQVVLDGARSP